MKGSADNPPLSHLVAGQARGLDVRIAQAAADALGRPLKLVPFETSYEKESTLTHEVAALLAAGVCEAVSGFPLVTGEFDLPTRATSRTPDYPGAKRRRERPYIPLQAMAPSRAYLGAVLGAVLPAGAPPLASLNDLGERKLGVVAGTLGGAVAMGWKFGALRSRVVTLNQRESPLDELAKPAAGAAPRFDAVLTPLALFDGWRVQHPGGTLVARPAPHLWHCAGGRLAAAAGHEPGLRHAGVRCDGAPGAGRGDHPRPGRRQPGPLGD